MSSGAQRTENMRASHSFSLPRPLTALPRHVAALAILAALTTSSKPLTPSGLAVIAPAPLPADAPRLSMALHDMDHPVHARAIANILATDTSGKALDNGIEALRKLEHLMDHP